MDNMRKIRQIWEEKPYIVIGLLIVLKVLLLFLLLGRDYVTVVYEDEPIHYDIAKSLFHRDVLSVHNVPYGFLKLGYPLIIMPTMWITDTIIRMKVIILINCLLQALVIVPLYFICKELKLASRNTFWAIIIAAVFPINVFAGMTMAENLVYVLTAISIWLYIKTFSEGSFWFYFLSGVLTYLTYYTKESMLSLALAYIGVNGVIVLAEICKPEIERDSVIKTIRGTMIFLWSFVVCHIVLKELLNLIIPDAYDPGNVAYAGVFSFDSLINTPYMTALFVLSVAIWFVFPLCLNLLAGIACLYRSVFVGAMVAAAVSFVCTFLYSSMEYKLAFVYGVINYICMFLVGFCFLPVIRPFLAWGKIDDTDKKAMGVAILFVLITALVVSKGITVSEDAGRDIPRALLRYVEGIVVIIIPLFFSATERMVDEKKKDAAQKKKKTEIVTCIVVTLFCGIYSRGVSFAEINSYILIYIDEIVADINEHIPAIGKISIVNISFLLVILGILIIIMCNERYTYLSNMVIIVFFIAVSLVSTGIGVNKLIERRNADPVLVKDICRINECLQNKSGYGKVLFISENYDEHFDKKFSKYNAVMDAYFYDDFYVSKNMDVDYPASYVVFSKTVSPRDPGLYNYDLVEIEGQEEYYLYRKK